MLFQEYLQHTPPIPKVQIMAFIANINYWDIKPSTITQNNAWGDQEPTDEVLIVKWKEFLQTPYRQTCVPE